MKYYVQVTKGNDTEILKQYDDLETAKANAKEIFKTTERGAVVSVVSGTLENGKFTGKYMMYKAWY